jgi:tRNA U34 2-thiouridine synthase MnmA/TrmU
LSGQKPELPLSVMAKIRSQAPLAEAHLSCLRKGQYKVIFKKPQLSFSPGQSLVFYSSWEELLGGGIII